MEREKWMSAWNCGEVSGAEAIISHVKTIHIEMMLAAKDATARRELDELVVLVGEIEGKLAVIRRYWEDRC